MADKLEPIIQIGPNPEDYDYSDPDYAAIQQAIRVGGFYVDDNSLTGGKEWNTSGTATKTWGDTGTVLVCTGTKESKSIAGSPLTSGWCFTAGSTFGVTNTGYMYAVAGKIGDFNINNRSEDPTKTDYLLYNTSDQGGILVATGAEEDKPGIGAFVSQGAYNATEITANNIVLSTSELENLSMWTIHKGGGRYLRYDGTGRNVTTATLSGEGLKTETAFSKVADKDGEDIIGGAVSKGGAEFSYFVIDSLGRGRAGFGLQAFDYKIVAGSGSIVDDRVKLYGPAISLGGGHSIDSNFIGSENYLFDSVNTRTIRLGGNVITDGEWSDEDEAAVYTYSYLQPVLNIYNKFASYIDESGEVVYGQEDDELGLENILTPIGAEYTRPDEIDLYDTDGETIIGEEQTLKFTTIWPITVTIWPGKSVNIETWHRVWDRIRWRTVYDLHYISTIIPIEHSIRPISNVSVSFINNTDDDGKVDYSGGIITLTNASSSQVTRTYVVLGY